MYCIILHNIKYKSCLPGTTEFELYEKMFFSLTVQICSLCLYHKC